MKSLSRIRKCWLIAMLLTIGAAMWLAARTAPVTYNESVTLLELSGFSGVRWPDRHFSAEEYLRIEQQPSGLRPVLAAVLRSDTHPPLYYAAAWLVKESAARFSAGPVISLLRLFSICCSVLSMIAFFAAGAALQRLRVPATLLFASLVSAQAELFRMRNYSLALLFVTVHFLILERRPRPFFAGLAAGLGFSTHYFTALATIPLGVLRFRSNGRCLPYLLGFASAGSLGIATLTVQFGARGHQFAGFPGFLMEIAAVLSGLSTVLFPHSILSASMVPDLFLIIIAGGAALLLIRFSKDWFLAKEDFTIDHASPALRYGARAVMSFLVYLLFLVALDFALNKQVLVQGPERYLIFLLPALAATFGALSSILLAPSRGSCACAVLLALALPTAAHTLAQAERGAHRAPPLLQSFDDACRASEQIIIGAGFGRGVPGAILHRMKQIDCRTPVAIVEGGAESLFASDLERRTAFVMSGEERTAAQERDLAGKHSGSWKIFEFAALPDLSK